MNNQILSQNERIVNPTDETELQLTAIETDRRDNDAAAERFVNFFDAMFTSVTRANGARS